MEGERMIVKHPLTPEQRDAIRALHRDLMRAEATIDAWGRWSDSDVRFVLGEVEGLVDRAADTLVALADEDAGEVRTVIELVKEARDRRFLQKMVVAPTPVPAPDIRGGNSTANVTSPGDAQPVTDEEIGDLVRHVDGGDCFDPARCEAAIRRMRDELVAARQTIGELTIKVDALESMVDARSRHIEELEAERDNLRRHLKASRDMVDLLPLLEPPKDAIEALAAWLRRVERDSDDE